MSDQAEQFDASVLDAIEIESGAVTQREVTGRDRVDKAGFFHLYVSGFQAQQNDSGDVTGLRLSLVVLGGDVADQVGAKMDHFVNFKKKDGSEVSDVLKKQNARLVRALSLAPESEILTGVYKAKWSTVAGRQFAGKVIMKDSRPQIDFGQVWKFGDEAAKKIPADLETLQKAGYPIEGQTSFVASFGAAAVAEPTSDDVPF